jgi:2-polyprenyl-6-methoxyphenol hydroxylase-like FAD-dependent oxidoreductase
MHDVVIVGGGIGGLTAAIALRRRGIDAHVYERAARLEPVGAGILVPPNAMQILARLGLADAVRERGVVMERAEIRDHRGRRLQSIDLADAERRHGAPTVALPRASLHEVLRGEIADETLHLGAECMDVAHHGDGVAGSVDVRFEDGSTASGAVLVGADGVHSVVRQFVAARARLRYAGQTAYRGIARYRLPAEFRACGAEVWAPGRRFGFATIAEDAVYWFATFDAPPNAKDADVDAPTLAARLADFAAPIRALVAETEPHRILRTDLYDLAPLPTWHDGRIVLIGDAAHASTPNLGQGGAQAIEDAWVLADRLAGASDGSAHEIERAVHAYEHVRVPKADFVVRQSRRIGVAAHLANPIGRELRNALMRLTPATAVRRQIDRIYTVRF